MAYLQISTTSPSASGTKKATMHNISDLTPLVTNRWLLLWGWGSKYRFCVPLNHGSKSRKYQMSHITLRKYEFPNP